MRRNLQFLAIYALIGAVVVLVVLVEGRTGSQLQTAPAGSATAGADATSPRNPLRVDTQTVLVGQQIYRTYCATCHGSSGRGDGPAASTLASPPPDLIARVQAGQASDAELYRWIAESEPDSAMPAFGQTFSDEQIWQLVAYLRTFRPAVAAATPIPTFALTDSQAPPATPPADATAAAPTVDLSLALPPLVPDAPEPLPPLVFVRQGNIWSSDGSGAPPVQLTQLDEYEYAGQPAYHAASQQIAFVSVTPPLITATVLLPSSALYVMNVDGSGRRAVWRAEHATLSMPAWTPDGDGLYLMYSGSDPASGDDGTAVSQVVRYDLASGARQVIAERALDPTLAADGAQLAYLQFQDDAYAMALMVSGPDGSGPREVLSGSGFSSFFAPRFSPDGKQLIVAAVDGPETDAQGYPVAGAAPRGGHDAWDGRAPLGWLSGLFEPPVAAAHGAPWDVWLVNTDGTGLRRLTKFYEDLPMALFTPDGAEVIIMGYGGFYRMGADGSNLRRISQPGDHGALDWLAQP